MPSSPGTLQEQRYNRHFFFVSLLPFTSSSVMIVVLGLFSSHATTATRRRSSRRSLAVGLKRRTSRFPPLRRRTSPSASSLHRPSATSSGSRISLPLSRPTSTRLTTKPPRPVSARLPSSSQSSARSIARPASRAHTPCFTTAAAPTRGGFLLSALLENAI